MVDIIGRIQQQHTGKFIYDTFYVLSIVMNSISFALGAARSLMHLEVHGFKSSTPSTKHTRMPLVSIHSVGGDATLGEHLCNYKFLCAGRRGRGERERNKGRDTDTYAQRYK